MRRFTGTLFVPEVAWNKFLSDGEAGVCGEDHVGKLGLRVYQMNFAIQFRQCRVQIFPLLLRESRFCSAGPTHPRVNFILDSVMIRRAKKQLTHNIENLLANHFGAMFRGRLSHWRHRDSPDNWSIRVGTLRCQSPVQPPGNYGARSIWRPLLD